MKPLEAPCPLIKRGDDIVSSAWKHAAVHKRTGRELANPVEDKVKHVVGFTYNEVSRRYVDDEPEFYTPDAWRSRPEGSVKQGSGGSHESAAIVQSMVDDHNSRARLLYNSLIDNEVAPEQARMVLPQSMMTSYYVTGSLAAWARAHNQRIDPHAQVETSVLARQWDEIIRPIFPVAWDALTEGA